MKKPKLTVVMPHYNDGNYLPAAVESILAQTWGDFELLIIDDASTDESRTLLHKYESLDKRIRVVYRETNQGSIPSFRQGAFEARAPYLHDMGADDIRYPTFFEKSITLLEKNPQIALSWSQFDWGESPLDNREDCGFPDSHEVAFLQPEEAVARILQGRLKLSAVSAVYRTEISRKYGSYDPKLTYLADWFLVHRFLFEHPTAFIPEPLCYFRVRGSNYSNVARHNKKLRNSTYYHLLEKLKDAPDFKEQCRKSALLVPLFHDLFWKLLFNPKYLSYWPYIAKRYPVKQRIKRSFLKHF